MLRWLEVDKLIVLCFTAISISLILTAGSCTIAEARARNEYLKTALESDKNLLDITCAEIKAANPTPQYEICSVYLRSRERH